MNEEFPSSDTHILKTFYDVATVIELHQYLEGVFYPQTYGAATFDDDDSYIAKGDAYNRPGDLIGLGQIVRGVRIGQIRSAVQECEYQAFPNAVCFRDNHGDSVGDKAPFGFPEKIYKPHNDSGQISNYMTGIEEPSVCRYFFQCVNKFNFYVKHSYFDSLKIVVFDCL